MLCDCHRNGCVHRNVYRFTRVTCMCKRANTCLCACLPTAIHISTQVSVHTSQQMPMRMGTPLHGDIIDVPTHIFT